MGTVRIPLHSRKYPNLYAIVDEADADLVNQYRWRPRKASGRQNVFYADTRFPVGRGKRKIVQMHRMLLGALPSEIVDHVNRDTLDNRRENLRVCVSRENCWNRRRHSNNKSGYKGVSRHKGRWDAEIRVDGKRVHLGSHPSAEDAAFAYDVAARRLHGEFAVTNVDLGLLPPDFVPSPPAPEAKDSTARDKPSPSRSKSSRFRGVSWKERDRKWYAAILANGVRLHLGTYDDEVEAALVYDLAAREVFGDQATLNFPGREREWSDE